VHLLGEAALGVLILCLLGMLVVAKWRATGSVLDERPDARFLVRAVNAFNLTFLLVVNPAAAVLLIAGRLRAWDATRIDVPWSWVRTTVEVAGVGTYAAGCALMMWALLSLRSSYQLGGMAPRSRDALVTQGPYALVRHPMYAAALAMALGLALALQSLACLAASGIYLVMLNALLPLEEAGLRTAYGGAYQTYASRVPRLIPFPRPSSGDW
jgi:protein-S-isoprenylcysteine O-methyltransferase Ste14